MGGEGKMMTSIHVQMKDNNTSSVDCNLWHSCKGKEMGEKIQRLVNKESTDEVVVGLQETFASGRMRSYKWRAAQLKCIIKMINKEEENIMEALQANLSKEEFGLMEKYRVGIIHEFLSMTVEKRAYIHHIVEFKEEFGLTRNTYHMLLKQLWAFYLAGMEMNWVVFLRDAYNEDGMLIEKSPLVLFKDKLRRYAFMKEGEEEAEGGVVGAIRV